MSKKDLTYTTAKGIKKREASQHDYENHSCPHVMTGSDYADRTIYERRARDFQGFCNPMEMTPFEQQRVYQEKQARVDARDIYIEGIQGRDGGDRCDKYENKFEDGPDVN
jgi:hypothetical protein